MYSFSKYCEIDASKITLICVFGKEDLKMFAGIKSKILEAIPGCDTLQDTQIELHFQVPHCRKYDDDGKCKKCNFNYKNKKDGKLCKYNNLWIILVFGVFLPIGIIVSLALYFYKK
jgi:hypothetical protein